MLLTKLTTGCECHVERAPGSNVRCAPEARVADVAENERAAISREPYATAVCAHGPHTLRAIRR